MKRVEPEYADDDYAPQNVVINFAIPEILVGTTFWSSSYGVWVVLAAACLAFRFRRQIRSGGLHQRNSRTSRKSGTAERFRLSVEDVARQVRAERIFRGEKPVQVKLGSYRARIQEQKISDKKTNEIVHGGQSLSDDDSILRLLRSESQSNSCSIQGTRSGRQEFFTIEEGCVAFTGRAYWVEQTNERETHCVSGYFQGDSFTGEVLTVDGLRGHVTAVLMADEAVVGS